jgi:hypothetical protein
MKKLLVFIILAFTVATATQYAQESSSISLGSNYLNIADLSFGYGLGSAPAVGGEFSKYYYGLTWVTGLRILFNNRYQDDYGFSLGNSVFAGIGAGVNIYNGGFLVPLYVDLRYWIPLRNFAPYLYYDAGLLLNFKELNQGTRIFVEGGGGITYTVTSQIAINAVTGLMIQMGNAKPRDAFIKLSLGSSFRF